MSLRLLTLLFAVQLFLTNGNRLPQRKQAFSNDDKRIELMLSFPYRGGKQVGEDQDFSFYAKVVIKNNTDTVASFYEDWNMWGYLILPFQVHTTKGIDTLHKKMRDWPKNFPSFQVLFPGDSLVLNYALGYTKHQSSVFEGYLPQPRNGLLGIKAIYQLDSALHAGTDIIITSKIKYRYKREEEPLLSRKDAESRKRTNQRIIIDSLPIPIDARRTFPLVKLESAEYRF
jgi:hypothetical protein